MASSKKKSVSGPARLDPGTVGGLVAAVAVLGVWGLLQIQADRGSRAGPGEPTRTRPLEAAPVPEAPPPGPAASDPAAAAPTAVGTAWEADPRWDQALKSGQSGLDLMKSVREWHEQEGGDPFRYRYQMRQVRILLEGAVAKLEAMRQDFAENGAAVRAIDARLAPFKKPLAGLFKESK